MVRIDRDKLPVLLLVFGSVFLLGVIASTIETVVGPSGKISVDVDPESGGARGVNESLDNESVAGQSLAGQDQAIDLVICIDALTTTPAILGIIAGVGLLLYGLARRYNTATAVLAGTAVTPPIWGAYFFLTNCLTSSSGWTFLSGHSVMTNEGGLSAPSLPPAVVVGVLGGVGLAGLALLTLTTRGADEPEPVAPDEGDTASAVGRSAGRAADRIEAADLPVDNAVYEAWRTMTDLLDIERPETTAPQDFAAAAIDHGLDEDDVAELTELFTDVRYGGKTAATREERAIEVLRRIERTYQDSDAHTGGAP